MSPRNFIVFFWASAGSTYLIDLLRQHPSVRAVGEQLLKHDTPAAQRQFIEQHFAPDSERPAAGFKLQLGQILEEEQFLTWIEPFRVKAFHMVRRNTVKQAVSKLRAMHLAERSEPLYGRRLSNVLRNQLRDHPELELGRLPIDPDDLLEELARTERRARRLEAFLARLPDVEEIVYEDLLEDRAAFMDRFCQAIGVEPFEFVDPSITKKTADDLADAVENFDELVGRLQGTAYLPMLLEGRRAAPLSRDVEPVHGVEVFPGDVLGPARKLGGRVTVSVRTEGYTFVVDATLDDPRVEVTELQLRHGTDLVRTCEPVRMDGDAGRRRLRFSLPASVITLPRAFDLVVSARTEGERRNICRLHGSHGFTLADPAPVGELQPLLISGPARSGSTFLMRLLAGHPQVSMVEEYPYESRHAIFWAHALEVHTRPADRRNSSTPATMTETTAWSGASPYYSVSHELFDWLSGPYVERVARDTKDLIDAFYREVADRSGKAAPLVFAEKFPGVRLATLFQHLYHEPRELFLVRDLRDVLCSARAMNRRRGTPAFGVDEGVPELRSLERMAVGMLRQYRAFLDRWPDGASRVVRYEDLVGDTGATVRRVLESCRLDAGADVVDAVVAAAQDDRGLWDQHATSATAASSVGRWRSELHPETSRAAVDLLAEVDELFGYAPTAIGPSLIPR